MSFSPATPRECWPRGGGQINWLEARPGYWFRSQNSMPPSRAKAGGKAAVATRQLNREMREAKVAKIEMAARSELAAGSSDLQPHTTSACRLCAAHVVGLTAADVLSGCSACNSCGSPVPPASITEATAIVREEAGAGDGEGGFEYDWEARRRARDRAFPRPRPGSAGGGAGPSGVTPPPPASEDADDSELD